MTRKDYELIAETINNTFGGMVSPTQELRWREREVKDALVSEFARALRTTNPRFDGQRFIDACNK